LSFETAPDALCGIELTARGQKLSWDIAEYLKGLEEKVEALLSADSNSASEVPVLNTPPADIPLVASPAARSHVRALNDPAHAVAS
jgi:hypothetical protein